MHSDISLTLSEEPTKEGRGDDHASSTAHVRGARPARLRPLAASLRALGRAVRAGRPGLRPRIRSPSPWRPRPARQRPRRHPGTAGRAPHARLRDDPGTHQPHRRGVAAEPRLGLPGPADARGRGPDLQQEAEGKRLFSLTEAGRAEAERGPSQAPWDEVAEGVDPTNLKLRDTAFQVGGAVMQVATAGSEAQKAKALEVLTEARRRIYSILAEDE